MIAPRPRRRTVAAALALPATVAAATLAAAVRHLWLLAVFGLIVTTAFSREAVRTVRHRRNAAPGRTRLRTRAR